MDEEEICRVCRSEGTLSEPLFHPCKCAGSIRYVHQDCLTEWLSHSRKSYCELCKHQFTFTAVYRDDMPEVLSPLLFLQQAQKTLLSWISLTLRTLLVFIVWAITLPYCTVWIWRFLLWTGNVLAITLAQVMKVKHGATLHHSLTAESATSNATSAIPNAEGDLQKTINAKTFIADCFEGQMITCFIIVMAAAAYLLYEWIKHNMPADFPDMEDEQNDPFNGADIDPQFDNQPRHDDRNHRVNPYLQVPPQVRQNPPFERQPFPGNDLRINAGRYPLGGPDRIPSPVAAEPEAWSLSYSTKNLAIDKDAPRIRASSEPVESSSSHRLAFEESVGIERWRQQNTRAASEEPRSSLRRSSVSLLNAQGEIHQVNLGHGQPPHAPLLPRVEPDERPPALQPRMERRPPAMEGILPVREQNELADDNNMDDDNPEDGIDAVLKAIGWRGSLVNLAQNVLYILALVILCLSFTVWIPYMIGIFFVMGGMMAIVYVPLSMFRLITDPVVDFVIWFFVDYAWPATVEFYREHCADPFESSFISLVPNQIQIALSKVNSLFSSSSNGTATTSTKPLMEMTPSWIDHARLFIEQSAPIADDIRTRFHGFAIEQTSFNRFVCIMIGYGVVISACSWYLSDTHAARASSELLSMKATMRQMGVVLKVVMFIAVEFLMFPVMCGFLLDLSAFSLLSTLPLASRIAYLHSHPLSVIFIHWFLGTGFMYLFALLVNLCRDNVRKGVMWFIRDPNDPQFHPIKEIAERPLLTQFQKIGASCIMYAIVIVVGIGGVVYTISATTNDFLPLRWNLSKPLSAVPFDLIAAQVLPTVFGHYKPKKKVMSLYGRWMKYACHMLRLSSFMLGTDDETERGTIQYKTWKAWYRQTQPKFENGTAHPLYTDELTFLPNGDFVRAPKHDGVPFIAGRRMLVPVDPVSHEPLNETERRLGHPASSGPGGDEANTTIVYIPPHFKLRIWTFWIAMWISGSMVVCGLTMAPLALGRHIFFQFTTDNVHDMYSFIFGTFLILGTGLVCITIRKAASDMLSQLTFFDGVRFVYHSGRSLAIWAFRWGFFLGSFGVLLPMLAGLIVELYMLIPLKDLEKGSLSIEVLPLWSRGFACMVIIHGIVNILPENRFQTDLNMVFERGIAAMNPRLAFVRIVVPMVATCLVTLLLPLLMALVNSQVLGVGLDMDGRIVQLAYPIVIFGIGLYFVSIATIKYGQQWVETVREENYLERRELHNMEEQAVL